MSQLRMILYVYPPSFESIYSPLAAGQKFVPLSLPLESSKKKIQQASTASRHEGSISQVSQKKTQSMPQSMHKSGLHSRQQSLPSSQEASSLNPVLNHYEPKTSEKRHVRGLRSYQYEQNYMQEAYQASLAQNTGLMNRLLDNPETVKDTKRPKLRKKTPKRSPKSSKSPNRVTKKQTKKTSVSIKASKARLNGENHQEKRIHEDRIEQMDYMHRIGKGGESQQKRSSVKQIDESIIHFFYYLI